MCAELVLPPRCDTEGLASIPQKQKQTIALAQLGSVSLKHDRKTADKTAKINSNGRASRMTARPHTTSSARVPQDRTQDRTDKIATLSRIKCKRKCERNFRILAVYTSTRYWQQQLNDELIVCGRAVMPDARPSGTVAIYFCGLPCGLAVRF